MFIFEKAPFPSCHASTLVEHEPGKLLAAWFGGKDEGAKDVQIWASTFDGKKWGELDGARHRAGPAVLEPGAVQDREGHALPLVQGRAEVRRWTGYVRTSTDNGKTWIEAGDDARDVRRPGSGEADSTGERHDTRGHIVGELPELDAVRGPFHRRREDLGALQRVSDAGEVQPDSADAV